MKFTEEPKGILERPRTKGQKRKSKLLGVSVCVCVCAHARASMHVLNHAVVSDSLRPLDWRPPSSSAHGIFQARMLEWVAISYSRESS